MKALDDDYNLNFVEIYDAISRHGHPAESTEPPACGDVEAHERDRTTAVVLCNRCARDRQRQTPGRNRALPLRIDPIPSRSARPTIVRRHSRGLRDKRKRLQRPSPDRCVKINNVRGTPLYPVDTLPSRRLARGHPTRESPPPFLPQLIKDFRPGGTRRRRRPSHKRRPQTSSGIAATDRPGRGTRQHWGIAPGDTSATEKATATALTRSRECGATC